ncbi:TfoX/Sxy family DNA transformation protein [Photobacterium chitinilyticum]|uniref:TfoX/Sxy family DNA transformation protein n=1 Tax=Photobacterium chitinilyticum TaxID=2485123 RepID=A0A3S3QR73_9GAMM|nr:TfoX/Sxy family DNA transformation protein [Photobacterium chitinilyticum]RWX56808.1 TfoX/Sxy family DNA transformation protein [Photobacterium chitinilyticum]
MRSIKDDLFNYLREFGHYEKRSMFGGTGIFIKGAMYAILTDQSMFLRGGETLDTKLASFDCSKFKHIKRSTTAVVNYYDVTRLYIDYRAQCDELVQESIQVSTKEKEFKSSERSKRLRDLPNMRLTLERMVKKAGVPDVSSFISLGAAEVYRKVRSSHGKDLDLKLLWMFAGAIDGCHWTLLKDDHKERLLRDIE